MFKPIWKGYITFGLVSIPVTLYSALKSSEIQLHLVDRRDKSKIHYVRINEKNGKEVPWEEVVKGYEYEKGQFLEINDTVLKKIAGKNTKVINIEGFIPKEELNLMEFYKPYYVVPEKNSEKGYVILNNVLKQTNKIGITKIIIHTRQYLAALVPHKNALLLNLIHYPEEVRNANEFEFPAENSKNYKITTSELNIAKKLIELMTIQWNPASYHDEYQAALEKWIQEKLRSEKPKSKMKEPSAPSKQKVINFVDLLKQSLDFKKSKKIKSVVQNKQPSKKKKKS